MGQSVLELVVLTARPGWQLELRQETGGVSPSCHPAVIQLSQAAAKLRPTAAPG